jgi:pimeloyl-ACP methyl ester carboxylesterase
MLNWYRDVFRHMPKMPRVPRVRVPNLMMWGMKDVALSHSMARPSLDYVDEGNLILFPEDTHWVKHDEAEAVNHYLLDFIFDKASKVPIR